MYRAIITPTETTLTIELPDELVGKPVEVLAFEIIKAIDKPVENRTFAEAVAFWDAHAVDMSNFKFDREEANER